MRAALHPLLDGRRYGRLMSVTVPDGRVMKIIGVDTTANQGANTPLATR